MPDCGSYRGCRQCHQWGNLCRSVELETQITLSLTAFCSIHSTACQSIVEKVVDRGAARGPRMSAQSCTVLGTFELSGHALRVKVSQSRVIGGSLWLSRTSGGFIGVGPVCRSSRSSILGGF